MSESAAPVNPVVGKVIPLTEIAKHTSAEDCWMAINGKVYNVTSFIDQHPGGEEVILEHAGTDATGAFEDVGHSEQAVEMLDDLYVGEGNAEELKIVPKKASVAFNSEESSSSKLPLILALIAVGAAYFYFKAMKD